MTRQHVNTGKKTPSRAPTKVAKEHLQDTFLLAFRDNGYVIATCKKTGVDYKTWLGWMKDPEFNGHFNLAVAEVTERYEQAATVRAVNGVDRPVFQGGKQVGTVKEYSDDLLKTMLRARNPEKYRETVKHEFDERAAQQIATEIVKAARRAIPDTCPHCKTNLGLSEKFATELRHMSSKLAVK